MRGAVFQRLSFTQAPFLRIPLSFFPKKARGQGVKFMHRALVVRCGYVLASVHGS